MIAALSASSPARRMLAAGVACVLLASLATWFALAPSWLGIVLRASSSSTNEAEVVAVSGPAVNELAPLLAANSVYLTRVSSSAAASDVESSDLIEEPDFFDEYAQMSAFFARQSILRKALSGGTVTLDLKLTQRETAPGVPAAVRVARVTLVPLRTRPIASLPATYWFQLAAGSFGFLLAYWVLALRPRDVAARIFAMLGAMIACFTFPAAIYSARELAMHGTWFRVLSSLNHAGAFLFGSALVALFWVFPQPVARPKWVWLSAALFSFWWILDALHLAPNQDYGSRLPVMLATLAALLLAIVQRVRLRRDPQARALLHTFGASLLLGAGLFVFTTAGSSMLGGVPPIPQAYAFGFFLIMHIGLALALRRNRLFELSRGAYAVMLWVLGALVLVALDAALAIFLQGRRGLATTLALLGCGLLYLPARSLLWQRLVARTPLTEAQLFARAVAVSFAPPLAQQQQWNTLAKDLFDALEVRPDAGDGEAENSLAPALPAPWIGSSGLTLHLPAVAQLYALCIECPFRGQQLFGPADVARAELLRQTFLQVEQARTAYANGVRSERERIARDLHDDVGSKMLTGVYQQDMDAMRSALREAIGEMRSIVRELSFTTPDLNAMLADTRDEISSRLALANCGLSWNHVVADTVDAAALVDYASERTTRALRSILRELVSNVVKHAAATEVAVVIRTTAIAIALECKDNGTGFDASVERAAAGGHGLRHIEARVLALGGAVSWSSSSAGTCVTLELPRTAP
jgi:two-component system, NarL family, sensor histidine kinase DevS